MLKDVSEESLKRTIAICNDTFKKYDNKHSKLEDLKKLFK